MENVEERVKTLLAQGSEHEKLDYKRTFNIAETRDIVEITKDIAAMLSSGGGWLLIGADDKGNAATDFTDPLYDAFDEATLRSKLKKYLHEPLGVTASTVKIDGNNFALIECIDHFDGFVIFKADGQYPHNGKTKEIFRKGDVFVRHGSSSERWQQHDINRIISAKVSKEKVEWLKDAELILTRIGNTTPPVVEEKKRLKDLLKGLKDKASDSILNQSDITLVIDEISLTAIKAVHAEDEAIFNVCVESLVACYSLGFDHKGRWRLNDSLNPVDVWYEILIHLSIIGGVCIEAKRYEDAKKLALQKVPGDDGRHYPNWYRHALTMSSRSNRTPLGANGEARGVLSATQNILRTDERYKDVTGWGTEEGITRIVQFDYLAALVAVDSVGAIDTSAFYTSFAFYDKERVTQMLVDILLDNDLLSKVFKSSPENVAFLIQEVDQIAQRQSDFYWDVGDWQFGLREFMSKAKAFDAKD